MSRFVVPRKRRTRTTGRAKASRKLEVAVGRPCPYCGNIMEAKDHDGGPSIWRSPRAPTIDHVFPLSLGGTAKLAVCVTCNNTKGGMLPSEWLAFVIQAMPDRADAVRRVFKSFNLRWDEPASQPGERA